MAWIESHTVLIRHRKLVECARELRLKPVYLLGHLHVLWHIALEQAEDGDLSQWSDEFIAESACYPGDAPQFVSLLQKHRWLDGKVIHDWLDYAGRYLEAKYKTSNPEKLKAIQEMHSKIKKDRLKTDLSQTLVSPPNLTNLTLPNQKKKPPASPALQAAFDEVYKAGLNIYALMNQLKGQSKIGASVPEEVLLRVFEAWRKDKGQIKDQWPWFCRVVTAEWEAWNSRQNEKDSAERRKSARAPAAPAIGQILAGMRPK